MEISLFDAAVKGFLNLLQLKVLFAMLLGVSIGTFTAVAPQGLGMPLVYAIALPIVISWEPITGIALLIGASSVSAICAAYLPRLPFTKARPSRSFKARNLAAARTQ
jgi:TctA family transporter